MTETYREFYETITGISLRRADLAGECQIECPFHLFNTWKEDEHPSMSVNVENGKYICFSCGDDTLLPSQGDAIEFVEAWFDVKFPLSREYVRAYLDGVDPPFPIPQAITDRWHAALMQREGDKARLRERKLISDGTLAGFKVGWDGQRYTIPIENYRGEVVNVRRYDPKGKAGGKMLSLAPESRVIGDASVEFHYGQARLWPLELATFEKTIYLMAGEWDTLLVRQLGLAGLTNTGGEGTWRREWGRWLWGRDVVICYDIDKAGRDGAMRVATQLVEFAKSVKVVNLPITSPKNGDFTDYILQGGTRASFEALVEETPIHRSQVVEPTGTQSRGDVSEPVALYRSVKNPDFQYKRVRIEGMIVGMEDTPYSIPKAGVVSCAAASQDKPMCAGCALFQAPDLKLPFSFDAGRNLLKLIDTTDEKQAAEMRRMVGVPPSCPSPRFDTTTYQNVDHAVMTPNIVQGYVNGANGDDAHTMQSAYYVYDSESDLMEMNRAYQLTGARMVDPRRQEVVHVIDRIEPLEDTVATFVLTPAIHGRLSAFRPAPPEGVGDAIARLAHVLCVNIARKRGREELVTAILLNFCAVQQFNFMLERIESGLIEIAVIGDTRTGKSETARALMRYIGLGDFITGENASFAGLVGGIQPLGDGRNNIMWGKIPQNDMRQLTIDEFGVLQEKGILKMLTDVRSARVADINKIQRAKAFARTRLLWITNPISGRRLRDYTHGVESLREIFDQPEDIARFDLVVACSADEVSVEDINTRHEPIPQAGITREALRDLVLFAWSRHAEDIVFTKEAEDAILASALEQSRMYSNAIPLVEGANQRVKLARLAVACAVLAYGVDDRGVVTVLPEHVRWSKEFLDSAYAKPSLDYLGFSSGEKEAREVAEQSREKITNWVKGRMEMARLLQREDTFTSRDVQEQLNFDDATSKEQMSILSRARMIEHTGRGYRKTPAFVALLKEIL